LRNYGDVEKRFKRQYCIASQQVEMMLTDKECREWHDCLNPLKQGQQPLKEISYGETVQREGNEASGAYSFYSSMEADFDSSNTHRQFRKNLSVLRLQLPLRRVKIMY
jgi:hypothetical protein